MTAGHHDGTGGVRLGVDFGESMTVIAVSGPHTGCHTLEFPGISREFPKTPGGIPVHIIPSLIEYCGGKANRSGDEADRGGAGNHPGTARWLRRYLIDKSPVQIPAGDGRMMRYEEAAAAFLRPVLNRVLEQYPGAGLVFTLPADGPAEYAEFLQRIARAAGAPSCSFVNEYLAAAVGCGYVPAPKEPFLIVTFAETGLEAAVVAAGDGDPGPAAGDMRVLARAAGSIGCRAVDCWIVQDLLVKFRLLESDPRAARLAPQMAYGAARLRELLPHSGREEIRLTDPGSGRTFEAVYTPADLDRILADNGVIFALQDCIARALSSLQMRGGDRSGVRAVLLLGAGCTLPAVQDAVHSHLPEAAIYAGHPLDAVARGAAEQGTPVRAQDRIACSYALRYWDTATREHHYRFLVHSGTRYPSAGQVARVIISAAYDGQTHLGIPLYEIGGNAGGSVPEIELVSDTGGGVRLAGPAQDADAKGQAVHANERSPTLLVATPPARKGEPRFECTFTIDPDRNLCLSARDLVTGAFVRLNEPVHRLN